jgi:phage terminase large subunit-like protein
MTLSPEKYGHDVLSGKIPVCEYVRLAVAKHFEERKGLDGYYFDEEAGMKPIKFFSILKHYKGEFYGKRFIPEPWQAFCLYVFFGWKRDDGRRRFKYMYIEVPRKNGKALEINTPILTTKGWTTHGKLKRGDFVFGPDGTPKMVEAVTPHYKGPCYELRFSSQETIIAHANHEWETDRTWYTGKKHGERRPMPLVTSHQISQTLRMTGRGDLVHGIKAFPGIWFNEDCDLKTPLDFYTFGVWLGDGQSAGAKIYTADQEVVDAIIEKGVPIKKSSDKYGYSLSNGYFKPRGIVKSALRKMGVLNNKRIPDSYFLASPGNRLELLAGIVDSDGHVTKNGQCEITLTSKRLADDVYALISVCGYKATIKESEAKIDGRYISPRYRIQFFPGTELPLRVNRKRERLIDADRKRSNTRKINKCEFVGERLVNCIQVDGGFYLAGRSMIKTHNSTYMAGLALYHILADGENAPEIYFTATKEKQARIVLDEARNIAKSTPEIASRLNILKYSIEYPNKFGKMESLGGDSKKQDGLNVSLGVLDELHEHKTFDMFDVLKTACGMRSQPIIAMITTAGFNKEYPCYTYRKHCIDVIMGMKQQNNLFAMIYGLDEEDDWKCEDSWSKANPSWNLLNREEFKDEAEAARINPSEEVGFKTKRLNIWTNASDVWIRREDWMKCAGPVKSEQDLAGIPCYGGLDLASVKDINALVLVFPINGIRHVKCWFWIPDEKVDQKDDIVPYRQWLKEGLIRTTPGNAIDEEELSKQILEILQRFNVVGLAHDRWGSDGVIQRLIKGGFPFDRIDPYKQTTLDMTKPVKALEGYVLNQELNHEGNRVLEWMASNIVVYMDSSGGIKFDKAKSIDKIDGMVALAMAIGEEMSRPEEDQGNFYVL